MLTVNKNLVCHIIFVALLSIFVSCSSLKTEPNIIKNQPHELSLNIPRYGHAVVNNDEHIFVIGGSSKNGFLSDIEMIDPQTNIVVTLTDALIPRRYHTAVWDGQDSIYILGGVSVVTKGSKRSTIREPRIEVFDIPTRQSKVVGKMPSPRRFGSAQYKNGKIFFIGGSYNNSATSSVFIYNINKNKWKITASMPTAKDTKTVIHGDHIYAIGGYYSKSALNVFERYDITTGEWQSLATLPQALSANSVTVLGDKIFSFGDYTELDNTLIYDINAGSWKKGPSDYLASRHNAVTVLNNKIYVIGGNIASSGSYLDYIQVFSFTNT